MRSPSSSKRGNDPCGRRRADPGSGACRSRPRRRGSSWLSSTTGARLATRPAGSAGSCNPREWALPGSTSGAASTPVRRWIRHLKALRTSLRRLIWPHRAPGTSFSARERRLGRQNALHPARDRRLACSGSVHPARDRRPGRPETRRIARKRRPRRGGLPRPLELFPDKTPRWRISALFGSQNHAGLSISRFQGRREGIVGVFGSRAGYPGQHPNLRVVGRWACPDSGVAVSERRACGRRGGPARWPGQVASCGVRWAGMSRSSSASFWLACQRS